MEDKLTACKNSSSKEKDRGLYYITIISISLFVIFFRYSLFIGLFDANDIGIPLNSFIQLRYLSIFEWNYMDGGMINSPSLWLLFVDFLGSLTTNITLVQHLTYYPLFPLSGLFSYIFLTKLDLTKKEKILLSILYMFSPYSIILFPNGSGIYPAFVLFPAFAFFLYKSGNDKLNLSDFLLITLILSINLMISYESYVIYFLLSIPFLTRMIRLGNARKIYHNLIVLFSSTIYALGMNILTFVGFETFYEKSYTSLHSIFENFQKISYIKPWSFILWLAVLAILIIFLSEIIFAKHRERTFLLTSLIESFLFALVFFEIGNHFIDDIFSFFIFSPFVDYEYFIFIIWTLMFVAFSIYLQDVKFYLKPDTTVRNKSIERKFRDNKLLPAAKTSIVIVIIALVIFTSFYGVNSDYKILNSKALTVNSLFKNSQIPSQYLEYSNFLRQSNLSYNYSFHSTIMPLTPGYANPIIFGPSLLPGFISTFSSRNLTTQFILQMIQNNQTNALVILSLLGIKYVAVMPNLNGSQLWAYNTTGSPTIQGYNGNYFFGGNWRDYLDIFSNWSLFKNVLNKNNLWVFENTLLKSPVLLIKNTTVLKNVCSGDFLDFYRINATGNELSDIGRSNYGVGWGLYYWNSTGSAFGFTGNNSNLSSQIRNDGVDIKLYYGIEGAIIRERLQLMANTSYQLSFKISQRADYNSYPSQPDQITHVDVHWGEYMGNPELASGYYSLSPIPGNITAFCVLTFKTPSYFKSSINATLQLVAEPPIEPGQYTLVNYTCINLFAVNISSKNIGEIMEGVPYRSVGDTVYIKGITKNYNTLLLDTKQSNSWELFSKSGVKLFSVVGVNGQLEFNITDTNSSSFKLTFASSPLYFFTLYISISLTLSFIFIIIPVYFIKKSKVRCRI